ncbi:TPA: hypothetical protein ACGCGF_004855 [Enterobacter mori]
MNIRNQPNSDDKLIRLIELKEYAVHRDINEAETRHKIIDFILHDFLSWPKNRVVVEEYINPGYADYILKKTNGDDLLFIEAKKREFILKSQFLTQRMRRRAILQ